MKRMLQKQIVSAVRYNAEIAVGRDADETEIAEMERSMIRSLGEMAQACAAARAAHTNALYRSGRLTD